LLEANKSRAERKAVDQARGEPFACSHVAIIMDGNRRWADLRKQARLMGHKAGVQTLKELVKYVGSRGLEYLTVYAFSSENWNRSVTEVGYLFELFGKVLIDEIDELDDNNVRLRFIGDLSVIKKGLRNSIDRVVERTRENTGLSLQVAINYGSRLEVTQAVREIARDVESGALKPEDINADTIGSRLYTAGIPDPDLLIRTGGEMRLSNYLLWQSAYTELYVTEELWPDFTPDEYERALAEFYSRIRRYGGD
jgi:undecaprenyl diphosphate synthase